MEKNKNLIYVVVIIFIILLLFSVLFFRKPEKIVNDNSIELNEICFTDDYIELIVGEEYQLIVEFSLEITENVIYTSSNSSIISVTDSGVIKALKPGESTIRVVSESGLSSEIVVLSEEIVVSQNKPYIDVSEIVINEEKINIVSGQNYKINYNVLPTDATNKKVVWETNDSRIATVTDEGIVTGRVSGTTVLNVYSDNGNMASVEVIVKSPSINLTSVELNPSELVLMVGDTYSLRTNLIPSNAVIYNKKYISSDSSVVQVSNLGLITALKEGNSIISVNIDGKISSVNVEVTAEKLLTEPISVSINSDNLFLNVGESKALTTSVMPTDASNKSCVWSSSNTNIVTVSNKGIVKAVGVGTATITATTTNGKKDTLLITVAEDETVEDSQKKPQELLLSISSVKLKIGETKQIKATVLPLTASQNVEWISGSTSIATVNNNGLITALKNGTTTIAAITENGLVSKINVTVVGNEVYTDSDGYKCLTPYTCFKQTNYGGNFCSTANCGPISSKGCSVTSWATILSMFVQSENGNPYNPLELTSIMTSNGLCSKYCSGDTAARKVFEYFGLDVSETYKIKDSNDQLELINHLKSGYPALLRVGPGCYTEVGHIMAILAINDSGLVWLYDPSSSRKSNRNTWVSLDEIVSCSGSSSWFMLISS